MSKINLGIFGCGGATFCIHLPALLRLSDFFNIKLIYDIDSERANINAGKISNSKVCSDPKQIFQDKTIDMVVILSPNHESLINYALDAGKHVFTEKPISLDIDYSKRLVKKAKDLKLVLEVGLMRSHDKVIKSFFDKVSSKDVVSGFFYKADGSDQIIREVIMPRQLKAYNFSKIDLPIEPSGISKKGLDVLKKMLWSGIHLITVICDYFDDLEVVFCKINYTGKSMSCILSTQNNQQFLLNISETKVVSYSERIRFVGQNFMGELEFTSPYLSDNYTKAKIVNDKCIETAFDHQGDYKSSFISMWENIFKNVKSGKQSKSAELALRVEKIARAAAEIC